MKFTSNLVTVTYNYKVSYIDNKKKERYRLIKTLNLIFKQLLLVPVHYINILTRFNNMSDC